MNFIKKIIDSCSTYLIQDKEMARLIISGLVVTFIVFLIAKFNRILILLWAYISAHVKNITSKIEPIHVEGATIISNLFIDNIERIGIKQKYKAEDFYLAKQYEQCQWYGILNKWDIERNAYKKIKEEAIKSFTDEFRQAKIIAIIYGRGGSGKSTLLRRLAIDCFPPFLR